MKYQPYNYQVFAGKHIVQNKFCGLFLEMGLGKTVVTLTAIDQLIYERFEVEKVLIIAPKFVALNVWTAEGKKWDHLNHLKFSIITGDPRQRVMALRMEADIYVINRENVSWLVQYYQSGFPFKMVVVDELSSFKNPQSQRFKALRIVRPLIKRLVGLTGTPIPNGLPDLWSQIYLMDQGERLGKTLTAYREAFLTVDKRSRGQVFSYKVRPESEQEIYDRIGDICISMKARDYLELPPRIDQDVIVQLPDDIQKQYDKFEREQIMQIADSEITALSAAALITKLLQFSNGAIYDSDRKVQHIHDAKLEALEEIIEQAGGQQVLICYNFVHDLERILKRFPGARKLSSSKDMEDWNKGKAGIMAGHPASMGHGLNLQHGGHILVWFGPTYNSELYDQACARLDRQGQTKPVLIYRLLGRKTMDGDVLDVLLSKTEKQDGLMHAVRAKVDYYKKNVVI